MASKPCVIAMVTDLELLSLQPEAANSQPSLFMPSSHCCRGDRREIHQLPGLMPDFGSLPVHANAIDLARMCWVFKQVYLTLIHLWRKERLHYCYEEIPRTKSSKQQQFFPGFNFPNFCLHLGDVPFLERAPSTYLINKCLLWADPEPGTENTKRTQSRPCAKEAPGLGAGKGQSYGRRQLGVMGRRMG